jgi:NADH:ubiquinone oxidoreductase subunit 2 (subunit N)
VTNRGLARRAPFSLALYLSGASALLGLPLTLSFGPHWLALRALAGSTAVWLPALALFAAGLGAFALFRAVLYWLEPGEDTAVSPEPRWLQAVLAVFLLVILWSSLHPAAIFTYSSRLAALFS